MNNGWEEIYERIIFCNQIHSGQPDVIQNYLSKPRSALTLQHHANTEVFAFVHNPSFPGVLHREIYSKTEKSWNIMDDILIPIVGPIHAMIQSRNAWYIFDKNGQIICMDMVSFSTSFVTSVARRNFTVCIHNDYIYIIAGNEYNPTTAAYDLPSKLIER